MVVIIVAWAGGFFGWAWVTGARRQREGYISNLDSSAYSDSWRDRSPSIGNPGGYHADADYDLDADDGGGSGGRRKRWWRGN